VRGAADAGFDLATGELVDYVFRVASRSDLARRSALATAKVSPSRQVPSASPSPGHGLLVPVRPWSVKSHRWHTQGKQGVSSGR
jgi:hypothetical protein